MNSAFGMDGAQALDAEAAKQQELAEKKRRRLERNRASARQCRKRKKEKKLLLRQQLALLEADNLQLRLKLQVGMDETNDLEQSAFITNKLNEMIKEGATESEIQKAIQELKERFSDYGRDRRSAIDFHIAQLKRCLQPTQTTRAILWLMSLAPKYHDPVTGEVRITEPDEQSELWRSLLEEVKPDAEQRKIMVSYTAPKDTALDPFLAINKITDTCNSMLNRIVDIICNKNNSLDQEMANIQNILSARQVAKFILWIDANPPIIQMLDQCWAQMKLVPSSIDSSGTSSYSSSSNSNNNNNNSNSSSNYNTASGSHDNFDSTHSWSDEKDGAVDGDEDSDGSSSNSDGD